MNIIKLCKENSASILTGMGAVGVVSTAIMAAKATPKALDILKEKEAYKQEEYEEPLTRFEKVLAMAPAYIPTALMGTATIACILGANHINKVKQAELISAYLYLERTYNSYREKVKEVLGEQGDARVQHEIEKEQEMSDKYGDPTIKRLFYDEFSNRYFEMSIFELLKATYDINRMYGFLGEMSLNNVYEFFKLPPTDLGNIVGWNAAKDWECYNASWIDIEWEPIETPDGLEAFAIKFPIDPSRDFLEW